MSDKEFNLLYEPWILVMGPGGSHEEVSILDAFRRAPEFRGLAGELPTQDIAVLRFLLAILHAVFGRYKVDGTYAPICREAYPSPSDVRSRWQALWDMGAFPMEVIEKYLKRYEDRFYLFHPERPFYQVASLKEREDRFGPFEASKLNGELSESDHKARLFSMRSGEKKNLLSFAEAARWLLHVNGFSETFGKLEAKGKTSKDAPSLGVGWLGKLGLVAAVGKNLFETLMLNLVLLKNGNELWGEERPVWESEFVKTQERTEIPLPDNLSELYTIQSRRLLLERSGCWVVGYSLLGGDFFIRENAFTEQMTFWTQTTKKGAGSQTAYLPRRHSPARQLWRDFAALAVQTGGNLRPGVVNWLSYLKDHGMLSYKHFQFQIASVSYGTMEAVVEDLFSDSISFNSDLLTELGSAWVGRITEELKAIESMVQHVGKLAQEISKAGGSREGDGPREAAMEQAYFRLDMPFRRWLERIDPKKDDKGEACDAWRKQARDIIMNLGRELFYQASPQAFAGRTVDEGKKNKNHYSAPEAFNRFMASIASI